jgi:hypothetical protein
LYTDAVERQYLRARPEQVFPRQCIALHEVIDFEQWRFERSIR